MKILSALCVMLIVGLVATLVLFYQVIVRDQVRWNQYKLDTHCSTTGQSRQGVIVINGSGGSYTEYEYRCDGDVLLWR